MNVVLRGPRGKLSRAEFNDKALDAQLRLAWHGNGQPGWAIAKEFDKNQSCFVVTVGIMPDMFEAGVVLGDVLHNFRGVLDHIAWHLVQSGKKPDPADPKQVHFPLSQASGKWTKSILGNRLPGVTGEQLAIIERAQPYHFGENASLHPLALLQEFSNLDKHQIVLPVALFTSKFELSVDQSSIRDCAEPRIEITYRGQPLEVDTELGRVYVTSTGPNPNVHVHSETRLDPFLKEGVGLGNTVIAIGEWVSAILEAVEQAL